MCTFFNLAWDDKTQAKWCVTVYLSCLTFTQDRHNFTRIFIQYISNDHYTIGIENGGKSKGMNLPYRKCYAQNDRVAFSSWDFASINSEPCIAHQLISSAAFFSFAIHDGELIIHSASCLLSCWATCEVC